MTTSRHGPDALGFTRATMAGTKGSQAARRSQTQKAGPSWNCRLQLACMNAKPLVTAGQPNGGEYVTGSRTSCPPRPESWLCPKSRTAPGVRRDTWNRRARAGPAIRDAGVARWPYRKVRRKVRLSGELESAQPAELAGHLRCTTVETLQCSRRDVAVQPQRRCGATSLHTTSLETPRPLTILGGSPPGEALLQPDSFYPAHEASSVKLPRAHGGCLGTWGR